MRDVGGRLADLRRLPWYCWAFAVIALVFLIVAVQSARTGHVDWAGFQVTISVLGIAVATLFATLPMPARLWIERQYELEVDDVIFYLYDEPGLGQVPRDILFQVHVAVANVGGRKAVLSAVRIEALLDGKGREIQIPEFPLPVLAQRVQQGGGWRITDNVMHTHSFLEFLPGPYVLERDDVVTMRLRARPGINWSGRWTLSKIQELAKVLERPMEAVRVTAIYRRGRRVVRQPFVIGDLKVLQQDLYVRRLRALTNDFQVRPTVAERAITD